MPRVPQGPHAEKVEAEKVLHDLASWHPRWFRIQGLGPRGQGYVK